MPEDAGHPALIADIGGTNVRFALTGVDGKANDVTVLVCNDYPDLLSATIAYLDEVAAANRPNRGAFAIACPVTGDQVQMTNLGWSFSIDDLRRRLGFENLDVVNDFTAIAHALHRLPASDRQQIGGGTAHDFSPIAVLGPGTGLGVSALVPVDGGWTALETEGGHVTLAPANDRESAILSWMRKRFGHVSAERALSGPGLLNLYEALAGIEDVSPVHSSPEAVASLGLANTDPLCAEALGLFCTMLGTAASDLALSLGARGGVYIAGGIVPALGNAFMLSGFRNRFEEKGRFSAYLVKIPTFVIVHPHPAFVGLRAILDRKKAPSGTRGDEKQGRHRHDRL